jgi:hypothetical protein
MVNVHDFLEKDHNATITQIIPKTCMHTHSMTLKFLWWGLLQTLQKHFFSTELSYNVWYLYASMILA